jgi:serine/threonine protein kinase
VYLSDFGVSKSAVSPVGLTGIGHFLGTPQYAAPEQVRGLAVDGRADQYALACVAFHLLTGSVPFERDQGLAVLQAHLSEPPPSLTARRPGLPAAADDVLVRALAKDPGERYASCGQFADALRAALSLPPYTAPGSSAPGHPRTEISAPAEIPGQAAAAPGTVDLPAGAQVASEGSYPATTPALSQPGGTADKPGEPVWRKRRTLTVMLVTGLLTTAVVVVTATLIASTSPRAKASAPPRGQITTIVRPSAAVSLSPQSTVIYPREFVKANLAAVQNRGQVIIHGGGFEPGETVYIDFWWGLVEDMYRIAKVAANADGDFGPLYATIIEGTAGPDDDYFIVAKGAISGDADTGISIVAG